jgi:glyoxylase-like metal-dependent hydrolase (beta-lactamase superfamily II)
VFHDLRSPSGADIVARHGHWRYSAWRKTPSARMIQGESGSAEPFPFAVASDGMPWSRGLTMKLGEWTFRAFLDGRFRLDGGSMFGVVPRVLWEKHHPPDHKNRIEMALRSLYAEQGDKRILVDTGLGDRWDEKGRQIFAIERVPGGLAGELTRAGIELDSITDVVLSHLHFDHTGGTICMGEDGPEPVFANARHWVQKQHWNWALTPTERDRASFRRDDFLLLESAGLLELVDGIKEIHPGVRLKPVHGHTPGQQMVEFHTDEGALVYCADLIPLASQVRAPWIMGFDLNPLLTLNEKREFLSRACEDHYILFFEHDPRIEAATVKFEDGKFQIAETFTLSDTR